MYPHASSHKLKLYSLNDIKTVKGLEKVRRKFWNSNAKEVCQDQTTRKWSKTALHGVIDMSWTLKKTALSVMEANKILSETKDVTKTKQEEGTLSENVERTLCRHRDVLKLNSKLAALEDPDNNTRDKKRKVEKFQKSIRAAVGKLKKAQESLRKAIENRGESKNWKAYNVKDEIGTDEPSADDIKALLTTVLERTWPTVTYDELSDENNSKLSNADISKESDADNSEDSDKDH